MPPPPGLASRVGVILVAAVALSSCTGSGPPPPDAIVDPVSGEEIPGPLGIRMAKVAGVALKGRPPRGPLIEPAERVRETISLMYTAAFVDPRQWRAGYPAVLDAFAPNARRRAREDLNQLTLGGTARSLLSVTPTDARIVIRFLPDERRRPVAALADMRFRAFGTGEGFEIPIRHEGEYLLRNVNGRWKIFGYEVEGRIGS